MPVQLRIMMDEALYRRLKRHMPAKGVSAFIEAAIKAMLPPHRKGLDAAYKAASRERWRTALSRDWQPTVSEGWPS